MHVQFAQSYIDVVMVWEELAARDQGDEIIRSSCTQFRHAPRLLYFDSQCNPSSGYQKNWPLEA